MKRLVFFDLDGTILEGISSENAFILELIKKRIIGFQQISSALFFPFRWFFKFRQYVFVKNKAYLSGLITKQITQLAREFVTKNLIQKIRPKLIECIQIHKNLGDEIVLLTGSPDFLAKIFGDYLNIHLMIATSCAEQNGRFSSLPPTQHPFHQQKLKMAKDLCEKLEISLKHCTAYGNSIHDYAILNAVGEAVAVTPDFRLRRIAQKKGWQIIEEKR